MILLIIVSLVIGYTLYVLYSKTSEGDQLTYDNSEVIKEAGPFQSQAEANIFLKEFCEEWQESFEDRKLLLVSKINNDTMNKYYVTIYVEFKY